MKRRERLLALLGIALLGAGAVLVARSHGPKRDFVLTGICRTPISVIEPPSDSPAGSAVVFHGLSANRKLMQTTGQWLAALGLRVYLVDFPGHGDSAERFSYARAEQCAATALDSLIQHGEIVPERTVLAGHSMGGAIAIRMADRWPTAATIAISPAPMAEAHGVLSNLVLYPMPHRMPVNLLVIYGGWESAKMAKANETLLRAAGGERLGREDFEQRRSAMLISIPYATHTSLLFDRRVKAWTQDWARNALGLKPGSGGETRSFPVLGGLLGLLGLILVFPLAASSVANLFGLSPAKQPSQDAEALPADSASSAGRHLLLWAVVALLAVAVLKFWVPLRSLHIMTGDYLVSFFTLIGLALILLQRNAARTELRFRLQAAAMACALGMAAMLVFGAWLNWQLDDAWMNGPRWLRFPFLLIYLLPYFVAEELALGPPEASRSGGRSGLFLALRLELWLVLLLALVAFSSGQILILLLAVYLLLFSVVQRLGSDAVRRRTGSAAAAAVFGAILGAWFVAAVFPRT